MKRAALVLAGGLVACAGLAFAQGFTQWVQPDGSNLSGAVINCATGVGRNALPCGTDALPMRTASMAAPVPNRGVATSCAGSGSLGTTSTTICAAGPGRSYIALQNQSDAATVYCNMMGGAATLGPPSRKLLPNASLVQGNAGGGFVSTAAINCIATATATTISAEAVQ